MGSLGSIFFFIIFPILIINQFVHHLPVDAAKSELRSGEQLNSNSTLVSPSGNFILGFFTMDITNLTYLGIWYISDEHQLWVANRDVPMNSSSGVLMIDESGTLKVISGTTNSTTLFNVSDSKQVVGSGINTIAVLEDSGNLVLYADAKRTRALWQSFDHPIDTLFPGMKLGHNSTTGQNLTLTSWVSFMVPASGAFTLRLEKYQNSIQLLIYLRTEVYWSSGPLENKSFQKLSKFQMNFSSDASGMFVTFNTIKSTLLPVPSILYLSSSGYLRDVSNGYTPSPYFCNGSQTDGCALALPTCRGQRNTFQQKRGYFNSRLITDESPNISDSDCMEKCLKDCNCTAYNTFNNDFTGCFIYTGENKTFIPGVTLRILNVRDSEETIVSTKRREKGKTWIWVLCVSIVLLSVLAALLCYVRIRRSRRKERMRNDFIHQLTGSQSFNYGDELEKGIKDAPDVKIFSFKAILAATDNFSNNNKLGEGGYGPVYKGNLLDGRQIAVKRLSKTSGQGIEEFKSELILISKLQHTNLVRLYGCCIHQEEKMLIYEFMPNKSLDFFLFAEDKKETIDWRIRFNIIEGVAQGLLYLHKYSRMKVIHRDLKVSNVLLDENMNPKIADFGMARIVQQNETEAITHRLVGTRGYIAPEYVMEGTFSIKSDVFSFGVLILEIISGKRNSSFYNLERPLNLVGYAWELWKGHASLELKDEALGKSFDVKQLLRTIHTGLLCVQENADDRPTMSEVISMLNNEIMNLPNPKQPAFYTCTQTVQIERMSNNSVSVNGLTVTKMEAR